VSKRTVTFAEAFKEAIVRFAHFGKIADDTTTNVALAAFVRCMAIIRLWSLHDIIDIPLPVLLKQGQKLHESIISGVLVHIKRRKVKGSTAQYAIDQASSVFLPPTMHRETTTHVILNLY
jgi:hypothetical protein